MLGWIRVDGVLVGINIGEIKEKVKNLGIGVVLKFGKIVIIAKGEGVFVGDIL